MNAPPPLEDGMGAPTPQPDMAAPEAGASPDEDQKDEGDPAPR
jgi:hypothetical protein